MNDIKSKHKDNSEYSIIVLGQQGVDFFNNRGYEIESSLVDLPDQPSFKSVQAIAKHAIDLYSEENIDELTIYYSHYVSVLENKPTTKQVLPLSQEDSSQGHGQMSSYEFEPDKESILSVILPQYVESSRYYPRCKSEACFYDCNENASDNATELIDDLSLEYNRARQAAITQQITEIVGGSAALNNKKEEINMGIGRVTQVMGPVIDVRFEHNEVPDINNAHIEVPKEDGTLHLTLEVALQLGDDVVRTIAMDSTDGVQRGMEVKNTGKDISVPVGDATLGRVFNVLGETIDLDEKIDDSVRRDPIHRQAPGSMNYLQSRNLRNWY